MNPFERKPFQTSFTVIPGALWTGDHPGDRDPKEMKRKLSGLFDCGILTIFDFSADDEIDDDSKSLISYRNAWSDLFEERGIEDQQCTYAPGIYYRPPLLDADVANLQVMRGCLDLIHPALARWPIYIHSSGRTGRIGMLVGCLLVDLGIVTGEEALVLLDHVRRLSRDPTADQPALQTEQQRIIVKKWQPNSQWIDLYRKRGKDLPFSLDDTIDLLRRIVRGKGMNQTKKDRYQGALLGLAVGDALGTTLEFTQPGSFAPIDNMIGGGPFGLKPGEWTDDTSMALCLAESLIEKHGFDPADQLQRYVKWYRDGHLSCTGKCFDIGNTVRQALYEFEKTDNPYSGSTDPKSAGNGSIMRLAPVPLFYAKNPIEAINRAAESSRTTHQAKVCVDACRYFAGLIVGAVNGASKEEILSPLYSPIPGLWNDNPLAQEIKEIASGSFKCKKPPEIKGTGYVVKSLEAALWAFYKTDSFRKGCLLAVNLGADADTTGAVFGQIAGAFCGKSGIPEEWLNKLAMRHTLESYADKLYELASGVGQPVQSKGKAVISPTTGYDFLRNDYPSWIGMDGIMGSAVEHVFQAIRSEDPARQGSIAFQPPPAEAIKAAMDLPVRFDWKAVRGDVMETLLREKFRRHRELGARLVKIGQIKMEQVEDVVQMFRGGSEEIGTNRFAELMEKIRHELMREGSSIGANRAVFEKLIGAGKIDIKRGPIFDWAPFPVAHGMDFDKIEGMMLGLAIGDSLGNGTESQKPLDRLAKFGEIRDYFPQSYADSRKVGLPTDDTQLAFWTLEQMLADNAFVPKELARLFTSGRRIFGIGGSVRQFIKNFKDLNQPWDEAGPKSSGNGALMRIAPMLIPYVEKPCSELWVDTALSAMITHNDSGSIAACVAFTNMLWKLLAMKKAPDPMWWPSEYIKVTSMLECDDGYQPRGGHFKDYKGTIWRYVQGHVFDAYGQGLSTLDACLSWYSGAYLLETVPSVLYILMKHGHDPEEAIVRAVNDTRDNDTIAAIVGAAVGALHGKRAIPDRWLKNLLGRTKQDDDGRVFELLKEARVRWWDDRERRSV